MTFAELLPLLLGSGGLAVGSLTLNVLFLRGTVTGSNSVPKAQHDALLVINAEYAAKFGEQTKAVETLAASQVKLIDRVAKLTARLNRVRA